AARMIGTTTNGIPSRTMAASVRTASGSDRIIFHLSFSICHWPLAGFTCHRTVSDNEQMKNAKWKMTNDPVATAPGSDKQKTGPTGSSVVPVSCLDEAHPNVVTGSEEPASKSFSIPRLASGISSDSSRRTYAPGTTWYRTNGQ